MRGARGRKAVLPRELSPRAWGDVLRRFGASFLDDHLALVAAGVAYWSVLALFPALALFVSLYGLFADPGTAADQARFLGAVVPPAAADFLFAEMTRVAAAPAPKLGLTGLVSFALVLWGANKAMKAMFEALNVAYHEKEKRNLLVINVQSLAFTFAYILFGAVSVMLVVVVPPVLDRLYLGWLEVVIGFLRWPILFAGMMVGTAILYRYGPSRTAPRLAWVTWGAVAAGLLWLAVSGLLSWYASSLTDFDKTYGPLGALVLLQTWVWASSVVVLTGAKLNAEAEHQTSRDTTVGKPAPMGFRGAVVADTVAPIPRPAPKPREGEGG